MGLKEELKAVLGEGKSKKTEEVNYAEYQRLRKLAWDFANGTADIDKLRGLIEELRDWEAQPEEPMSTRGWLKANSRMIEKVKAKIVAMIPRVQATTKAGVDAANGLADYAHELIVSAS